MLIRIADLEREPVLFDLAFAPGVIHCGAGLTQTSPLAVEGRADLIEEHGDGKTVIEDIRVRGGCTGEFEVACARCLVPVRISLTREFDLIFRPLDADFDADVGRNHGIGHRVAERAISTAETEIGYYQTSGLLLEDVVREQMLLSLPARVLCREDCKGLCPRCGRDLNTERCVCGAAPADVRWSALAHLADGIKG